MAHYTNVDPDQTLRSAASYLVNVLFYGILGSTASIKNLCIDPVK